MQRRDFLKGSLVAGVGAAGTTRATAAVFPNPEAISARGRADALISPFDLRCESTRNPLAIDSLRPRLSWKLEAASGARNQSQSAYRITVASTRSLLEAGEADVWDSDTVISDQQLFIEYDGPPFASGMRCFWRVQVWDQDGRVSEPSEISWWEMGLLHPEDWKGFWISDGSDGPATEEAFYEEDPAPLFRKHFHVYKSVKRARLYAVGLGYCELRMNGRAVSDRVLDPVWTSFESGSSTHAMM